MEQVKSKTKSKLKLKLVSQPTKKDGVRTVSNCWCEHDQPTRRNHFKCVTQANF